MKHTFFVAILTLGIAMPLQAATVPADLSATVSAIGRINGQALACGHREITNRIKTIMVARVPKTREYGELLEKATTAAFLAQGKDAGACPPQVALIVELEAAARPLVPPSAHQAVTSEETPDVGINPRYLLQATSGRAVMDSDFRDRFQLITFGYTFCPDICPTTLIEMTEILKQLGKQADRIQPLFISVDPERDTLPHLRQYLAFFDSRILGATGSPDLVRGAAKNFKVRYEKVIDPSRPPDSYAVDHSAGMYLLAPGGQFITRFPYGTPVADIVSRLNSELQARAGQTESASETAR